MQAMTQDPLKLYLKMPSRGRFTFLMDATQRHVQGVAWNLLHDGQLAEDVAQEVFIKLMRPRWKATEVRSGWGLLTALTISAARTRLRGEARRHKFELVGKVPAGLPPPGSTEKTRSEVRDAVGELPVSLRRCVELRYFGGLGTREIAHALGVSRRTVQHQLKRAHALLHDRLTRGQAGLILSVLGGGFGGHLFSAPPASPEFATRLREIARRHPGSAAAGGAPGSRGDRVRTPGFPLAPALSTLAAVLVLSLVGTAVVTSSDRAVGDADHVLVRGGRFTDDETGRARTNNGAQGGVPRALARTTAATQRAANAGPVASPGSAARVTKRKLVTNTSSPASLEIRVVNEDGKLVRQGRLFLSVLDDEPRGGVWMVFTAAGEEQHPATVRRLLPDEVSLEAENSFRLDMVPAELFEATAEASALADGYLPAEIKRFRFERGKVTEVALTLRAGRTVDLVVRDALTGEGIEGARVELVPLAIREQLNQRIRFSNSRACRVTTVTHARGVCRARALAFGPHFVTIRAEGYRPLTTEAIDLVDPPTFWPSPDCSPASSASPSRGAPGGLSSGPRGQGRQPQAHSGRHVPGTKRDRGLWFRVLVGHLGESGGGLSPRAPAAGEF